jgi:uncharacterized protein YbdZ (MbtH family)
LPDDPLTEKEQEFLALLQDPRRYSLWARKVRSEWEQTPEGRRAVEAVRSKQ